MQRLLHFVPALGQTERKREREKGIVCAKNETNGADSNTQWKRLGKGLTTRYTHFKTKAQ